LLRRRGEILNRILKIFFILLFILSLMEGLEIIKLPKPRLSSTVSVEEALLKRRSIRNFKKEPLTLSEVSQLLWSAQGITEESMGLRTAPSAGALYPIEIYIVVGNVINLPPGIYKYNPKNHELVLIMKGDKRKELAISALGQKWIEEGAIVIVISAVYERTTSKYGERGIRYVHMEAGHVSQNIYLQAVALNLGTVAVGAFYDEEVKKLINMQKNENPLYLMPVGRI